MTHRIWLALGMLLMAAATALADRAPPPGPRVEPAARKTTAPVKVVRADLAKEGKGVTAKVQIPQKVLAAMAVKAAAPAAENQSSLPWWTTLVAGLAMSAGAVGLLFVARGNPIARRVATAALMLAMLAGGYALADLRIPDEPRRKPAAEESVVVEIVDGDAVVITLAK
jgi:hypothetical protein